MAQICADTIDYRQSTKTDFTDSTFLELLATEITENTETTAIFPRMTMSL
jgi:hypothetical protein